MAVQYANVQLASEWRRTQTKWWRQKKDAEFRIRVFAALHPGAQQSNVQTYETRSFVRVNFLPFETILPRELTILMHFPLPTDFVFAAVPRITPALQWLKTTGV